MEFNCGKIQKESAHYFNFPSGPDAETEFPIHWGSENPHRRGPIIATFTDKAARNVIGAHSGSYSVYRALSIASGKYPVAHRADLTTHSFSLKSALIPPGLSRKKLFP